MRVAVVGLGFMGATHVQAWGSVAGAELVAVHSSDERKLAGDLTNIAGNFGGHAGTFDFTALRKYSNLAQLWNDPGVEVVDICLPTHLHYSAAKAALRSGKHVLVEKPLTLDGKTADELMSEAEASGRILMTAHVLRFMPSYRALAEGVWSGKYGVTRAASFHRRCAAPVWSEWLGDASKSGGGVFDLLIHDLDFALMVFGVPKSLSATGYENLRAGIDTAHATLHYENGFGCVIAGGWHHRQAYPFSMQYTVTTDGGTFEYDSLRGDDVFVYGRDGEKSSRALRSGDAFVEELEYFHECCVNGTQPAYCPPVQSAKAVKLGQLLLEARSQNGEKIECRI